jgi:hypothetical protein
VYKDGARQYPVCAADRQSGGLERAAATECATGTVLTTAPLSVTATGSGLERF